jgi:hypothetical protein
VWGFIFGAKAASGARPLGSWTVACSAIVDFKARVAAQSSLLF